MRLPIAWLKQFVTVSESAPDVAERFVALGFEAEAVNEAVIDLEITPNRGDLLSVIGLAREYAASTKQAIQYPTVRELIYGSALPDFTIEADPAAYHRIAAIIIHDVQNQQSPAWLKEAVEAVGMNSIDLIVDLTNYVMFELGIPMHAFDLDQLPTPSFKVRLANAGETFVSLKDETVKLPGNDIVVESNGELIDLLGIRGGKSSMIQPSTKNILVWAVSLPRPLIRQTVKKTGLRTEGAYRHERETDWAMVPTALERFVELLSQLGGGTVTQAVDLEAKKRPQKQLELLPEQVNALLGATYTDAEIANSLERLGFTWNDRQVVVPSWRYFDISFPEDLVEEVARLEGYDRLPRRLISTQPIIPQTDYSRNEALKDQLATQGFVEVYTESFSGKEEAKVMGWSTDQLATLANPVNQEFAYCRPSMIPNLLKVLVQNAWSDDAMIFEFGTVFPSKAAEETKLALAAYGNHQKAWSAILPAEEIQVIQPDQPLAQFFKLRRPVTVTEVDPATVQLPAQESYHIEEQKPQYQPVSIFPPAARDISVIVDQTVDPVDLAQAIKEQAPDMIILVELFDQYSSDKFGAGKQSLAYHIIYQDTEKTLSAEIVDQAHQKIVGMLQDRYQATIR